MATSRITPDVVVLAGGLGTRLSGSLGDRPKLLAPIGSRPFLDILADWLADFGLRRVVLSLGHKAERVIEHLASRSWPLDLIPVIEPGPQGTAGALRLARAVVRTDPVLVLNGDTFVEADLRGFVERHRATESAASILCVQVAAAGRYGRIELDATGQRVAALVEKDPTFQGCGLISVGVYLFSAALLDHLMTMAGPSLERDVFERLPMGMVRAEITSGSFIDIGTPESLAMAAAVIPAVYLRSRHKADDKPEDSADPGKG